MLFEQVVDDLAKRWKIKCIEWKENEKLKNGNHHQKRITWSIWGSGSIKIEFSMSKDPCMQNMSFVAARSVESWRFYVKKLQTSYKTL